MACNDLVTAELHSSSLQSLPTEDSAVRTVIAASDDLHNVVHSPAIKLLIRDNKQRQVLSLLIPFHSLQRVIPIPFDALINGQHKKLHSIAIFLIQFVHHMDNNGTVLASTGPDCYLIAFFEQLVRDNGLMDFLLEALEETLLADRLEIFRPFDEGFALFTHLADHFCHFSGTVVNFIIICLFFYFKYKESELITIMNHSIITEYQEDHHQFSPAALSSQYAVSKSPERPGQDLYMAKLQSTVKELKNTIKKNKPIIEQLKAQRKFLKKIHEKQKQKIQCTKIENIRLQYENEIEQLRQQRHKHEDIIAIIHEESSNKAKDFVQAKEQIQGNRNELLRVLQEVRKENICYADLLCNKEKIIEERRREIVEIQSEIKGKMSVEKRYREVLGEIESMEYYRNQ